MRGKGSLDWLIGHMERVISIANSHRTSIPSQTETKLKFLPTILSVLLIKRLQHIRGSFRCKSKYSIGLLIQKQFCFSCCTPKWRNNLLIRGEWLKLNTVFNYDALQGTALSVGYGEFAGLGWRFWCALSALNIRWGLSTYNYIVRMLRIMPFYSSTYRMAYSNAFDCNLCICYRGLQVVRFQCLW